MGSRVSDDGAIYSGFVAHKRARPKRHSLRYNVFSMLVDLDRLGTLDRRLRLFSLDRFNLFSIFRRDFGPRDGSDIAAFIRRKADAAGVGDRVVRIEMLCYPRILGYAFNPITTYFLRDAEDQVVMLAYEVSNTFGEHHFYQAVVDDTGSGPISHTAKKQLFVSPFNTLEGSYRFAIRPPGETVFTGITLNTVEGGLVTAYFQGEHRALTDWSLSKLALAYPLMTAKIIVAIHWEALLLWLKGVPPMLHFRRRLEGHGAAARKP